MILTEAPTLEVMGYEGVTGTLAAITVKTFE
jgi:hypothetical protein